MFTAKSIFVSLLIFIAVSSDVTDGYNILGVFPTASKSHFIIGDALMQALAEKGHTVTMISPYPMKNKNYRGIEVTAALPAIQELLGDFLEMRNHGVMKSFVAVYEMGILITNLTLNEPGVKKFMQAKEKFDIVIMDQFVNEGLIGFADHFNAPVIQFGLFGAISWNTELVGTPSPPSYVPNPFTDLTDRMSLLERIQNLAVLSAEKLFYDYYYLPRQEALFKAHFPNAKKSMQDLRKNTALVLLNQHVSLSFPRPYLPNMVEVGGMHINRKRKPLPATMQKFLDDAKDGAIYFSLGSNLKSKNLPPEKRDAILKTFASLKQRVLWKFEDTKLPGKSDNVLISDWFPQDDILAHPNVRLFITHGGLLSTTESIYHSKPFIGIPIFGDQFLNMARAEANGYAITVDYNLLSRESFQSAITEMLTNPVYTQRMNEISARYRDQPIEPKELAIYWIEYIVRHKGAPHLHCAAQELSFIQYHNIDAMIILYGGIFLVVLALAVVVLKGVRLLTAKPKAKVKNKYN